MNVKSKFGVICVAMILFTACRSADAHNLFVLIETQPNGQDLVDIIFEHSPYPGKGTYNQPLL